jgi:hypothetical protein
MDTERRRSGATMAPPTVNESYWALVDAGWTPEDVSVLVALWKRLEDAHARISDESARGDDF